MKEASLYSRHPSDLALEACQSPELLQASKSYPLLLIRLRLLVWYLKNDGPFATLAKIVTTIFASRKQKLPVSRTGQELLHLEPGEWVEVKSRTEISETLDQFGKHRGLRFVPEMYEYCGKRYRVLKRVEKICVEGTADVRQIKDTVLLEGGLCKGSGIGCDRSCFHFWREAWLRRTPLNDPI